MAAFASSAFAVSAFSVDAFSFDTATITADQSPYLLNTIGRLMS